MKEALLERRIARLEKLVNESVKGNAKDEIMSTLASWMEYFGGKRRLINLRKQIMDDTKRGPFVDFLDLVDELELNDGEALAFYGNGVADNLYDSDEFDVDVLDVIDELLHK